MKPQKSAVEATVDTVGTAIGMLWDWLSSAEPDTEPAPPPSTKQAPSLLDLLEPHQTTPKDSTDPHRMPAVVIDTHGESEDD